MRSPNSCCTPLETSCLKLFKRKSEWQQRRFTVSTLPCLEQRDPESLQSCSWSTEMKISKISHSCTALTVTINICICMIGIEDWLIKQIWLRASEASRWLTAWNHLLISLRPTDCNSKPSRQSNVTVFESGESRESTESNLWTWQSLILSCYQAITSSIYSIRLKVAYRQDVGLATMHTCLFPTLKVTASL